MITIGIDASRANLAQRTGTEWYAWNVIQELKRLIPTAGYRVVLYVKEPLLPDLEPLPPQWRVQILRWLPGLLWTQLRLSLHFLRPARRPDLLYIPAHTIPLIHPRRVVSVAHDLGFERDPNLYNPSYIGGRAMNLLVRCLTLGRYGTSERDYQRWSMRLAVRQASRIIAISKFTAQELRTLYGVDEKKVRLIYNGYTALAAHPSNQPPRDSLLYIGRIEHKKNIRHLVQAYAALTQRLTPCPPLFCIGRFGYGAKDSQRLITELKLEQHIHLVGYIPADQLFQYWQRAKLFILPSKYEGFGIPMLEAMAQRVSVVCSDLPPLREIGQGHCFYFNPNQPDHMAQTIAQAWLLPAAEQQRRLEQAYRHAQTFSWQRCAEQTWQVLLQAVD